MGSEKHTQECPVKDMNSIPIKEFKLTDLKDNTTIMMIAKRNCGKSWIVRAILHHYANKMGAGIVISPTDRMSDFYSSFIPSTFVHYEFDEKIIQQVLDRQKWILHKAKERAKQGKKTNTKAFVVMDDCLADKGNWAKSKTIFELLFNGRHYHITYILTMQYPMGIGPGLRQNFDYVFLLADNTFSNQKRLFDHYAGCVFQNFEAFRQVFPQLTADYGCMVIVSGRNTTNPLDQVMCYKAPDLTNTKTTIGGRQYNKFNEDNYNSEWLLKGNSINAGAMDKLSKENLKKNKVTVRKIAYE